jgi:hypothetical protein
MAEPIPAQAWERIKEFLKDEKTGSITLNVKTGQIRAWELTEYGRIPNAGGSPKEKGNSS